MPKLTVNGVEHEVESGQRLVLAIEGTGVNIGHRCGGNAKCTTCRVSISDGEPDKMTAAEFEVLSEKGLVGEVRLSCQIICDHDMSVEPGFLLENEAEWDDTGPTPETSITPDPVWIAKP
ncbi:MAG: (2Fe-2S)-binding protein [Gemmatimonadetes bacterium]|nr:(2Fe-2S)-binding protein [Gemmatimonadota bacterium]MYB62367.1 (2Fe-2S)-binding protein [Gemmatimonadota bacterium]